MITVLYALSFAAVVLSACKLPPQPNINWSELSGEWYEQTVHNGAAEDCQVITKIGPALYGANIWLTSISPNGATKSSVTVSLNSGKKPYQTVHFPYNPSNGTIPLQQALAITVQGVPIVPDKAKLQPSAYFTDYNYFIMLGCGLHGEKVVTVFGKNREPTADDIMNTRMLLIDIGQGWENVLLEFSPCLGVLKK